MPNTAKTQKLSIEDVAKLLTTPMKPRDVVEKLSGEGYKEQVIRQTIRQGFDEGTINLDDEMQLVAA